MAGISTGQYLVYSSKVEAPRRENAATLHRGSMTDRFVSSLKTQVISLQSTRGSDPKLDPSDECAKWFSNWDPASEIGLNLDNIQGDDISIKSWEFRFPTQWHMKFSSSIEALNLAFDDADPAPAPAIQIHDNGAILCCGLDPSTASITGTVKDLFRYAGFRTMPLSLPSGLADQSVSLNATDSKGKRNCLWFNPSLAKETTVRLQFRLDRADCLKSLFASAPLLSNLTIDHVDVVCRRTAVEAITAAGPSTVNQGQVTFTLQVLIPLPGSPLNVMVAVEYVKSTITIILKPNSECSPKSVLALLSGLIPDSEKNIQDLLEKDNVFDRINLRRIRLYFRITDTGGAPSPLSFDIDIEAVAKFGSRSDNKPVAFLFSYAWSKESGNYGFIRGQLWNWSDEGIHGKSSPYYEDWRNLQPTRREVATSINLVTLIPGHTVENIPENIPTDITNAFIFLSAGGISIGGSISCTRVSRESVPHPYLGEVSLRASYSWGKHSQYRLSFGILAGLQLSQTSSHQEPAVLKGKLEYDSSSKAWALTANLHGLYASALHELFDPSSTQHIMPFIDNLVLGDLTLQYSYTKSEGRNAGRSVGSSFKLTGTILVAGLELALVFEHKSDWRFEASLKPQSAQVTLGDIIRSMLPDDHLDLPHFLVNTPFNGQGHGNGFRIALCKGKSSTGETNSTKFFHCIVELKIQELALTFAQSRRNDSARGTASKMMIRAALIFPHLDIPVVGNIPSPIDEVYYLWIHDRTNATNSKPGLTRQEIQEMNNYLSEPLAAKGDFNMAQDSDVLLGAGSHFVVMQSSLTKKICILDYGFQTPSSGNPTTAGNEAAAIDQNTSSAHTPFKKSVGPLSIRNLGLKYSGQKLHIMLDAALQLGPLYFAVDGFALNIAITSLDKYPEVSVSLDGLALSFEESPLTIAGAIRRDITSSLEAYAGGLIIGYEPYQFEAAGFYGSSRQNPDFKSMFVFMRLDGPLVQLEFGEITGVSGGFGYNSEMRIPTVEQVIEFPFIAQTVNSSMQGQGPNSAVSALEELIRPDPNGWFTPSDNTYWAAAGMKLDALKMISVDAVALVKFGTSVKFNLLAVCTINVPKSESGPQYAHIELGIAGIVDPDYGVVKVEAQLSPRSFILHPQCHVTGGFALAYWFDAPHAKQEDVGNFVFTLGGYHRAFKVPANYPNPPRLRISWSAAKDISITGESYFAITPKVLMAGGRLHAVFSSGSIQAWFDASMDSLINYKPFHFTVSIRVSVGGSYDVEWWFIQKRVSAEVGADLLLWGPPCGGYAHVDFWVVSFDFNFGESRLESPKAISLISFYELVLQTSVDQETTSNDAVHTIARPKNEAHIFRASSGLTNPGSDSGRSATWSVRGGSFSFLISCKMPIDTMKSKDQAQLTHEPKVYAKPMKGDKSFSSVLDVEILSGEDTDHVEADIKWRLEKQVKSLPTGLWGNYSQDTDPSHEDHNASSLLNTEDGTVQLMTGVLISGPPPMISPDRLRPPHHDQAMDISVKVPRPFFSSQSEMWLPASPWDDSSPEHWEEVHDAWVTPQADAREQADFVSEWAKTFRWEADLAKLAPMPQRLKENFKDLYIAVPLISRQTIV